MIRQPETLLCTLCCLLQPKAAHLTGMRTKRTASLPHIIYLFIHSFILACVDLSRTKCMYLDFLTRPVAFQLSNLRLEHKHRHVLYGRLRLKKQLPRLIEIVVLGKSPRAAENLWHYPFWGIHFSREIRGMSASVTGFSYFATHSCMYVLLLLDMTLQLH